MPFGGDKDVPPHAGEKKDGRNWKIVSFFLPKHTTEGVSVDGQHSVLIVDRSQETRDVLQTALERRGVRTMVAGRAERGVELARQYRPDLIVLDLEMDDSPAEQFATPDCDSGAVHTEPQAGATLDPQSQAYQPRMILLGNLRGWRDRLPEGEFVRKPYHYGPLIRRIEELLASDMPTGSFGPCRRCSSSAEQIKERASN